MSYEVAQQVLDKLALATELFTAGYMGTAFTLYAWKRTAEPTKVPLATPLSLPQAAVLEPIERASENSMLADEIALSLPVPESIEQVSKNE
ncbi:hypothetical protein JOY44_10770 [Phormidium sp. CLA17]|uniref:hypothetical protein n=1 Tax=Leptolyngbya sp. Cla-17 TaxID=2803751 RepID=UPI00149305F0|nr:hypothetical protein [Leptolyngbya sp. Cla-17]MBM0742098.1 hypothetical protein [Leptolyngbya sp. Cla-17]